MLSSLIPAVALLAQQAVAQAANPTSSYYAPGIPTDVPVAGNYTDYLRPRVHYSPPRYFMNGVDKTPLHESKLIVCADPNGMHRAPDGTYHLYYQFNPLTPVAGNQASSTLESLTKLSNSCHSTGVMRPQRTCTLGRTKRLPSGHRTTTQ